MARVTVEDCLEREDNRFALVVLAAQRTRALMKGAGAARPLEEQGRGHGAARDRRRQGPLRPPDQRSRAGVHRGVEPPRVRLSRRDRPSPGKGPKPRAPRATAARRDRELEAGSLAHYEDPAYYTADVRAAARRRRVLRGARPARGRTGARVRRRQRAHRAPDGAPRGRRRGRRPLRADARRPARAAGATSLPRCARASARCAATCGACGSAGASRSSLATFNTALHLYTRADVERFLARVREHLAPARSVRRRPLDAGGRRPGAARRRAVPRAALPPSDDAGPSSATASTSTTIAWRQVLFVSMEFEPVGDPGGAWMTPLAHRQFFPQEWEALLHYNGFAVERVEATSAAARSRRTAT